MTLMTYYILSTGHQDRQLPHHNAASKCDFLDPASGSRDYRNVEKQVQEIDAFMDATTRQPDQRHP